MALVAETAASAIIGQLVDTVLNYANTSWWPSARSVKTEAEKLQAALPQIRLVLAAVQGDRIRQKNPDFDARLWQFRDALEAADDVLDEIKYYELEEKIKARDSEVSGPLSGCKRKLVDFVKNTFVNDGVLGKLREAVKGLEAIASDVGPFLQLANNLNQQLVADNFRETGSFFIENSVVGREKEKETIVEWLTSQLDGDNEGLLSAYSIFGIGGMGKTTLAQLVCKDQRVIDKFDLILWICVSDNSGIVNAKVMIKKIIEDITKESCSLDNLNTLQNTLKQNVGCKKFLLVLDDIWRDDTMSEWEKIVAPLRSGERESKILLTTRMESVAKMIARLMEGENEYLNLAGLEENDFMSLFYRHAFAGTNPNKYQHLHEIGDQIAKKLRACPLNAKVIGGCLNNYVNFEFWNKILNEDIVNMQVSKDYIIDILKLSYYHLPAHLQLCFRYCSIFPQDYKFRKEKLVKFWMGSGLISRYAHGNIRPEDVACDYLDQLTRKSFFHLDLDDNDKCYVIHDLLHDLARCVSEGECLRIIGDVTINIPRTIRHLFIEKGNDCMLREIHNLNKLQTLVINSIDHNWKEEQEFSEALSSVKSLRVLKLNKGTYCKIPSTIGDLIHLRCLFIDGSWILGEQLKSLYRLYHLEVLEVSFKLSIKKSETEGICNLINLRYLEFPRKFPSIGKLSSLQELDWFDIKNKNGYKISELKNLVYLRKLRISGLYNISNPDDAKEAKMNTKENLKSLFLSWFCDHSAVSDLHEKVADNLKPSISVIELIIHSYPGARSPCWMIDCSCCNLITVKLEECHGWEHLPPLGQLNSLKRLELCSMYAVKQVGYSLYGKCGVCVFPSLRWLLFSDMPEWEDWIRIDDKLFFPCLQELEIRMCPKLKILPTLPSSLKRLTIDNAALDALPEIYQVPGDGKVYKSSLSFLYVCNCPNIETLIGCQLLETPKDFRALKNISIMECKNLLHIPIGFAAKLPSLTDLTVMDCPNLITFDTKLSAIIKTLTFGSCGNFENSVISSLQNLTSLTKLVMDGCPHIQSLPPKEVFARLKALCHFEVKRCIELTSLSGLEELTALRTLKIEGCEKLIALSLQQPPLLCHKQVDFAGHHLKLDKLTVDHCLLLLMEPLRSLRYTRGLTIDGDSQITSLPEQWLLQNCLFLERLDIDASSLQFLPQSMERLCSLQSLYIRGAKLLMSLPNLPASVNSLKIWECHPELEDLCRRGTGLYWPMISRIPDVDVCGYDWFDLILSE